MKPGLNIFYIGHNYGTSRHRADALRRIGHNVVVLDPWEFLPNSERIFYKIIGKAIYEAGPALLEPYIRYKLIKKLKSRYFDVIWINQCELIGIKGALLLKKCANWLVTYANDDPFGPRDKKRFCLYRNSLGHYDLIAVVRRPNVNEAYAHGAQKVILVPFTADEIDHAPIDLTSKEKAQWASEVVFIGTWMPERGPFISRLLQLGMPISLYGNRWQKAPEWPVIKNIWRGPGIAGPDYVKAIRSAKICLGLISKQNRDQHTRRSAEVSYIGSVLCAERTEEHLAMFKEDEEAVFWSTPEECAEKCFSLLSDEERRNRIAEGGRRRCMSSGYLNEPVMRQILSVLTDRI